MKNKTLFKTFAIIMTVVVFATCFSIVSYATAVGGTTSKIKVEKTSVDIQLTDTTVDIPIAVEGNTGFISARFKVLCNSDYFTLTGVKIGDNFTSLSLASEPISNGDPAKNPYMISLEGDTIPGNITADGTLVTLTYTVKADTPLTDYDFTISECEVTNFELKTVPFEVVNNALTVTYMPGDINGDGKVNSKDINRLINYIAGVPDTKTIEASLDVNGDGKYGKSKDLNRLINYIASGKDDKEYPIF